MRTSGKSRGSSLDELTLFVVDFPVKTLAAPTRTAKGWKARGPGYGRSSAVFLASYDPVTQSWRTSQVSLEGGLTKFSGTWPRSGLLRNGIAYQLPPLVPLTSEIGSGSWPTPTASHFGAQDVDRLLARREECRLRSGNGNGFGLTLQQWVSVTYGPDHILNPEFSRWLMGYPEGWTDLGECSKPTETP